MNGGARGRRWPAATDMASVPATGGDATDYGTSSINGSDESAAFEQKRLLLPGICPLTCPRRERILGRCPLTPTQLFPHIASPRSC